jgi:hypothetical protein
VTLRLMEEIKLASGIQVILNRSVGSGVEALVACAIAWSPLSCPAKVYQQALEILALDGQFVR